MRIIKLLFSGIVMSFILSSCGINSNFMLKTPRDFVFDSIPMMPKTDYVIAPNDIVSFKLYANDGFKVIDLAAGTSADGNLNANNRNLTITYLVRADSMSRLPMLGDFKIAGLTKLEAEMKLEKSYSKFYVNPYVQIGIDNQRVFIFRGNGADAQVIKLDHNNTTLLETLAKAGGIPDRGRSKRVKLIRQVKGKQEIYQIDLSTIDNGLKYITMIMQANDIVYVEPVPEISRGILQEVNPIVSLISSAFLIYLTLSNIQ